MDAGKLGCMLWYRRIWYKIMEYWSAWCGLLDSAGMYCLTGTITAKHKPQTIWGQFVRGGHAVEPPGRDGVRDWSEVRVGQ